MRYYALIVGGGSGSRMGSAIPKQFMLLDGKPVLMHTIEAFSRSAYNPSIYVVLHIEFQEYWRKLCGEFNFSIPHTLVNAGPERFYSVKNGLKKIKGKSIIAIHDAVRPIIGTDIINNAYLEAEENGCAVAAVPAKDSVRQVQDSGSRNLNRSEIYLVQTPQVFQSNLIQKAYEQEFRNEFTDDASVLERTGNKINLIAGDYKNIKITVSEDLLIAELFLRKQKKAHQSE